MVALTWVLRDSTLLKKEKVFVIRLFLFLSKINQIQYIVPLISIPSGSFPGNASASCRTANVSKLGGACTIRDDISTEAKTSSTVRLPI